MKTESFIHVTQRALNEAGYENAIAIATKAEVEAGAACGQLASIVEVEATSETSQS
jgi:adenine C2-methylase RlmN of 23S rRNA A2503 and tRNA A37